MSLDARLDSRWSVPVAAALLVLVGVGGITGGCEGTEAARAALRVRDAEWSARIGSLRKRQGDAAARLPTLPTPPPGGDDVAARASRLRIEAAVQSSNLVLADLDALRRDLVKQVGTALDDGREAGEQALEAASQWMDEHLRLQEQELASTEVTLASAANGERNQP